MANFNKIAFVLLVLAISYTSAIENRRYRAQRLQRPAQLRLPTRPIFARQEEAPAAVTPYPSAADIKPAVPFEEENAAAPEQVYGPPEQTYGPPEQTYGPPEQTYGPPEAEPTTENSPSAEELPTTDAPEEFAPNPDAEEFAPITSSRLTQARRPANARRARPARLQAKPQRKQKIVKTQRLTGELPAVPVAPAVPFAFPAQGQQYYVINQQPFAQLQAW